MTVMLNSFTDCIRDIIENETYLEKTDEGYRGVITVCYREQLSEDILFKLRNMEDFYEVFDGYYDCHEEYSWLINVIANSWDSELTGYSFTDVEEEVKTWLYENVDFELPYNHYLNQDVLVNIVIDAGDGNNDYTFNNFISYYADSDEDIEEVSSILWLARQHGYSKKQLKRAVFKRDFLGSRLLRSIYEECLNVTSHMNALVFMKKMTLKEYLELLESPTTITLCPRTTCGLVDFWNGAGGLLSIQLEQPVVIPKDMYAIHLDGNRGYGIREIYGVSAALWQ